MNAFACQQLSLEVGLELLNRLASISSPRIGMPRDARYAFPAEPDVAKLRPEECKALGFSGQKVRALLGLARAITRRDVDSRRSNRKTMRSFDNACSDCTASDGGPPNTCY